MLFLSKNKEEKNMVADSWTLVVEATSKNEVEEWLTVEPECCYRILEQQDTLKVGFESIDDAFRFRMHFDEVLLV